MQKTLTPFQDKFVFSKARYSAFVGGWATGKTMSAIIKGCHLSEESPNNLGLICRKEYTDLRDSTIKDFILLTGRRPDGNKEVRLDNGSVIMFRHADELDSLQNINLGWAFIEQGEEFETADRFDFLKGRIRRQEAKTVHLFITANTNGHNWVWERFKAQPREYYELTEATTYDNAANLRPDFILSLERDLKINQPNMFNRYVLNSWEEADVSDKVLPEGLIRKCVDNRILLPVEDTRKLVVCDPARFGDDETVIIGLEGGKLKMIEVCNQQDTMTTAGKLAIARKQMHADLIAVESTGLGAGICDRLREMGQPIHEVNPAEKSRYPLRFRNLRSEIWWTAREQFEDRTANIPNDNTLITQLSSVKYKMSSDQIITIEPKDQIKKRLGGRSPDRADALVIGLYALQFVPNKASEGWEDNSKPLAKAVKGARGW